MQRLVDALGSEGLVLAASSTNGVRLGPAILGLAAATRFLIADVARKTLEALAKETGETVDLSILDQDKVVFIHQIPGTHRLTAVSAVGISFPLHSTAPGKAILAAMQDSAVERLRARMKLIAQTANTITRWEDLQREINASRIRSYTLDREKNSLGISAVATAIEIPSGEIAAISTPIPTQRFAETESTLTAALLAAVSRFQKALTE